jgi:hypothetical protein
VFAKPLSLLLARLFLDSFFFLLLTYFCIIDKVQQFCTMPRIMFEIVAEKAIPKK